ncbi:MAG: 3-isopropylmalate dehydratase small subunit [Pseudomonadota bacterium]
MEAFDKITGVAAPLPLINIDTDMILPKQYLKTIKRAGLGIHLFEEIRFHPDGSEVDDFVLNRPAYRNAKILVVGDNFGCGSSREHAPWALKDFGIRVMISTSFADIFYNNCFKNGLLPITLPQEQVDLLMADAARGANATLTVDLAENLITTSDGAKIPFQIDANKRHNLLQGLDEIGLTLEKQDQIEAYEASAKAQFPWLYTTN